MHNFKARHFIGFLVESITEVKVKDSQDLIGSMTTLDFS